MSASEGHPVTKEKRILESIDLARTIVNMVEDKKAENIVLLDMRPDAIIADYIIICTGLSDRQLRALADNVREGVKEQFTILPYSVEGSSESGWMLMDYGNVVLHLFQAEKRRYYDLEGLWRSAQVLLRIQ